jgi:hypothetical protein
MDEGIGNITFEENVKLMTEEEMEQSPLSDERRCETKKKPKVGE